MSCFRTSEKSIFLLLKWIDKLSKNIFTKLKRTVVSIFEDTKPKAEERRAGVRVLGQTHNQKLIFSPIENFEVRFLQFLFSRPF